MADLPKRAEYEAKLAKTVAEILRANQVEWQDGNTAPETERRLRLELLLLLGLVFVVGSRTAAGELGIGIATEKAGSRWGDFYAGVLSRGILDSARKRIERARIKDLTGEQSLVPSVIEKVTDPKTWGNFAATEITRANTAGGEYSAMIYNIGRTIKSRPEGPLTSPLSPGEPAVTPIPLTPGEVPASPPEPPGVILLPEPALAIWHTDIERDLARYGKSRVCPICGPLHGRPRDEWAVLYPLGPPGPHPGCRCWIDYEVPGK